jgi:hypothetical protein
VRLLVNYQHVGSGWISSSIRGGHEDIIIQYVKMMIHMEKSISKASVFGYQQKAQMFGLKDSKK